MDISVAADLPLISPLIVLAVGAMLLLALDVLITSDWPKGVFAATVVLLAILSTQWYAGQYVSGHTVFGGLLYADPLSCFFTFAMLFGALFALMIGIGRITGEGIDSRGEYYVLFLVSTFGALLFASAAELVTLFLGLEIMSLALYCMCGAAIRSQRSAESAMKYFLLGSFSAAFLLYGAALLYGLAGTTSIPAISEALGATSGTVLFLALGLILVGLVFKIGVAPFHFWVPDVYEGSPTPVTAFMACVIKASAIAVAIRMFWTVFDQYQVYWSSVIWILAFFTILGANLIALRQRSLKRMLAYSSIAHAGYIMMAFLAPGGEFGGGAAILYYIVVYTLMTIGAFGVVLAVCPAKDGDPHSDDISRLYGLSKTKPAVAFFLTVFMLSLAGIPPGMGGFLGKFYVFSAVVKADYVGLAIVGVTGSLISCYYYLRVIVAMYFIDGEEPTPAKLGVPLAGTIGICALGSVLLGVFPSALYEWAARVIAAL